MASSERSFPIRVAFIALLLAAPVHALDLGRVGPVWPVAEPDLLALIQSRLEAKQRSGELARIQAEFEARSRRTLESPAPVAGLVRTRTPRSFLFDPTVTATEPVRDHEGRVLVEASTRVNPLDYVSLSRPLIFFDARDQGQVSAALALRRRHQSRAHLILTGGSYIDFMRRHDMRVYYDQQGLLVRRLGIRQVPALVTQEGRMLRIDELKAGA
ncbi:MAG: type-F conjugative transfer system protein TraW [Thiobacillus sp.]|nr:type-F conjugative transfer system protein TraW [Thiobacillus sp.]